jgi:hypothetical protein
MDFNDQSYGDQNVLVANPMVIEEFQSPSM